MEIIEYKTEIVEYPKQKKPQPVNGMVPLAYCCVKCRASNYDVALYFDKDGTSWGDFFCEKHVPAAMRRALLLGNRQRNAKMQS